MSSKKKTSNRLLSRKRKIVGGKTEKQKKQIGSRKEGEKIIHVRIAGVPGVPFRKKAL